MAFKAFEAFERRRRAFLRELRGRVNLARHPAQGEDLGRPARGCDLALLLRPDANPDARLERHLLAAHRQRRPPLERRVDLLLAVVALVVLGVALEAGRKLDRRDPERGDAEAGADSPKAATEDRLEVLGALHGQVGHRPPLSSVRAAGGYA